MVPDVWKIADINNLFKDGECTFASNCRPISILPAVSKILERVVHIQMYKFIEGHSILLDAQFGFREGFSTSSYIIHLSDIIYKTIDENKYIGVLDLKKAFNTVDHSILLK